MSKFTLGNKNLTLTMIQQGPVHEQKDASIKKKNISFHDLPQIMNMNAEEIDEEIPEEIEEIDEEFDQVAEELIQEHMIKDHAMSPHYHTNAMVPETGPKIKYFSDIIQEELDNNPLTCTETTSKNCTKSVVENTETINQEHKDTINKNLSNKEVTPLSTIEQNATEQLEQNAEHLNGKYDGIIDEELTNETYVDEPNVTKVNTEPHSINIDLNHGNYSDIVEEETYEAITEQIVEKEAMQTHDSTKVIAQEYQAQNKDGDENVIVDLVNKPGIVNAIDKEIMWYSDGCDQMKDDSECDSRDGENIIDYFSDESPVASFTDLA